MFMPFGKSSKALNDSFYHFQREGEMMFQQILNFFTSGIMAIGWQQLVMYLIAVVLIWLAIAKDYEPMLLLPIGFGALLVNPAPRSRLGAQWSDRPAQEPLRHGYRHGAVPPAYIRRRWRDDRLRPHLPAPLGVCSSARPPSSVSS